MVYLDKFFQQFTSKKKGGAVQKKTIITLAIAIAAIVALNVASDKVATKKLADPWDLQKWSLAEKDFFPNEYKRSQSFQKVIHDYEVDNGFPGAHRIHKEKQTIDFLTNGPLVSSVPGWVRAIHGGFDNIQYTKPAIVEVSAIRIPSRPAPAYGVEEYRYQFTVRIRTQKGMKSRTFTIESHGGNLEAPGTLKVLKENVRKLALSAQKSLE